jgi:DNA-binding MarR family transcriptional regulator
MSSELRITIPLLKVLDAMLQAPDQNHWGFEIMKKTGLKSGTLYPLLARLETAGWVESDWETQTDPGRPRRRYYRLTGVGARSARIELARLPGRASSATLPGRLRPSTVFGGAR